MKKTIITLIALLLVICICIAGCDTSSGSQSSSSPDSSNNQSEIESDANVESDANGNANQEDSQSTDTEVEESDIDDEITGSQERRFMKVEYSTAFSVEYITDDILLVTDAENQKFLLVPRGQAAPSGYEDAILLYTPVERIIMASSTQFGMVEPFDIWDNVVAIVSNPRDWPFDELNERLADGRILYVGSGMGANINFELLQEVEPDLTFLYTGNSAQLDLMNMLDELDLPYAVDNEYMEPTHQGRMEWIKFLAVFFGKAEEGVAYVDEMLARLDDMAERLSTVEYKPKVAWGMLYNGIVYVPGADTYVAGQIRDAGGENLFAHIPGGSSSQISMEEFYEVVLQADIWINSNMTPIMNYDELYETAPILADVPVVVDGEVWQFGPYYYTMTGEVDIQVIELAAIFHPDLFPEYQDTKEFHHFQLLPQ